jgi:hypothetical protein
MQLWHRPAQHILWLLYVRYVNNIPYFCNYEILSSLQHICVYMCESSHLEYSSNCSPEQVKCMVTQYYVQAINEHDCLETCSEDFCHRKSPNIVMFSSWIHSFSMQMIKCKQSEKSNMQSLLVKTVHLPCGRITVSHSLSLTRH